MMLEPSAAFYNLSNKANLDPSGGFESLFHLFHRAGLPSPATRTTKG